MEEKDGLLMPSLTRLQQLLRHAPPSEFSLGDDSLLALPIEILRQILGHLTEASDPALAILRRSHPLFYHMIPSADVCGKVSRPIVAQQLRAAQDQYPYLFPPGHYACFACLRVKPEASFADDTAIKRAMWNLRPYKRYCLKCCIQNPRRQPDEPIAVQGVMHYLCHMCREIYPESQSRTAKVWNPCGGHTYIRLAHICYRIHGPLGTIAALATVLSILLPLPKPQPILLGLVLSPFESALIPVWGFLPPQSGTFVIGDWAMVLQRLFGSLSALRRQ